MADGRWGEGEPERSFPPPSASCGIWQRLCPLRGPDHPRESPLSMTRASGQLQALALGAPPPAIPSPLTRSRLLLLRPPGGLPLDHLASQLLCCLCGQFPGFESPRRETWRGSCLLAGPGWWCTQTHTHSEALDGGWRGGFCVDHSAPSCYLPVLSTCPFPVEDHVGGSASRFISISTPPLITQATEFLRASVSCSVEGRKSSISRL